MDGSEGEIWKVLLIEDDEDDYWITRDMLAQAHRRKIVLEWAPSYEAGQQRMLAETFDAVLIDYNLGVHSGIELIRSAVARSYRAPLILLTGRGNYETDVEAMQAGATLYISKAEVTPLVLERDIRYAIERKRIEQERSDLIDSIQDGFYAVDKDWRIIYINQRAAASSGKTPKDLIGLNLWELYPALVGTEVEQHYQRVMETRQKVNFEMQGIISGTWYSISAYTFHEGISVYWQDISEKKKNEEKVQRSEALYRSIIRNLPGGGVAVVDPSLHYLIVDGPLWEMMNVDPDWLVGQAVREIGDASLAAIFDVGFRRALAGGMSSYGVEIFDRVVWSQFLPLRDDNGQVFAAMLMAMDITDRKRAEEALRASERLQRHLAESLEIDRSQLAAILDNLPVGVWITDAHGRLVERNRLASRIWFGDAPQTEVDEQTGEYPPLYTENGELLSPEENPDAIAMRTGQPVEPIELKIRRFDGGEGTVLVSAAPIRDRSGNVMGAFGVNVDITERKNAEEALRFSEERFDQAFNTTPQAQILSRSASGRIEMVNTAFERLFGYSRQEVAGKSFAELDLIPSPAEVHRSGAYETEVHTRSGETRRVMRTDERMTVRSEEWFLTILDQPAG